MKKGIFLIILVSLIMQSCASSKETVAFLKKSNITLVDKVLWTAVSYKGTPYKFGGTTKQGMDCSGLIYTSFKHRGMDVPRTSKTLFKQGKAIPLNQLKRGDLVFFKTRRTANVVNHVGLVTSVNNGEIKFIHSTTSKGVIVSSLSERYWKNNFVKAKTLF